MTDRIHLSILAAVLAALLVGAETGVAQVPPPEAPPVFADRDRAFFLEGEGGIAAPGGSLSDFTEVGGSVGLAGGIRLNERFAVRADVGTDGLTSVTGRDPDVRLVHFLGSVEVDLIDPTTRALALTARLGAGATNLDSDAFIDDRTNESTDVSATYPSVVGAVRGSYDVSRRITFFAGTRAHLLFADESDTEAFAHIEGGSDAEAFDTAWSFPITAGIRIGLE